MSSATGGYRSHDHASNFNRGGAGYDGPRQDTRGGGGGHSFHKRRQTDQELYDNWTSIYAEVEANPDAFNVWEDLIESAEGLEGGLCKASSERAFQLFRFSYDLFLKRFPFAHGYWIRYAELEFRLGFTDNAELVYLQAVSVIPLSVDLWTAYCAFKLISSPNPDAVRMIFERATGQAGLHYLAHTLWDKYIEFEEREDDPIRLFNLYDRIIRVPLHQYAKYFAKFMELCPSIPVEALVDPAYLEQFRAEFEVDKSERAEQDERQDFKPTAEEVRAEEETDLRSRIANYHVQIYVKTQNQVAARWQYESTILRPFFHVVYLAEVELVNWRRYIHFEEVEGDIDRVVAIYERAVIPTAQYEEMWLRYARWLIASNMIEQARVVFQRGSYAVPIGRTELRLQYARFEEAQGNPETAKDIYNIILEALPTSTETIIGLANLMRRHESTEAAIEYLQAQSKSLLAAGGFQDAAFVLASVANMRLYAKNGGPEAARQVYASSAAQFLTCYYFWREYLRFEINEASIKSSKTDLEIVESVYNQIKTMAGLTSVQLKDLGHIYMVHLLSNDGLASQAATQEYFAIDGEIHKVY